jgi:tetratricopeptide (TPR) repeat protein
MPSPLLLGIWLAALLVGTGGVVWRISHQRLRQALATVDLQNQAEDALDSGDLPLAESLYQQALRLAQQARLGKQANTAAAHWGLFRVNYQLGRWDQALRHCKLARSAAVGDDAAICQQVRRAAPMALLDLQFLTGDWVTVERRARQLLAKSSHTNTGELHQYLGRALVHLGRPADAVAELERALSVIEPNDPGLALLLHDLGVAQLQVGLSEAAVETFDLLAHCADEDPDTCHLTGLAAALANAGFARSLVGV